MSDIILLNILLVEDDEDDYFITTDLLSDVESIEFQVDWEPEYDSALEKIKTRKYDVLIFDYQLGARNGVDLLNDALVSGCNTPVILLTGQNDSDIDVRAMNSGAADYLVKGKIDSDSLARSIRYSLARKESEDQIRHMAYHDDLTGLPNRVLFEDRVNQTLLHAERSNEKFAVLFIDLDNFKHINDTFGHRVGDLLLSSVADSLLQCIRAMDSVSNDVCSIDSMVARQGGDEFTILLRDLAEECDVAKIVQRILTKLREPLTLESYDIYVSASIGVAVYPNDGENIDDLLKNADVAMYEAKKGGKDGYQYYRRALNEEAIDRFKLENQLRKALEQEQFVLHYQPQFNTYTNTLGGMEALVRWMHPDLGLLYPGAFIEMAENIGIIHPMGTWVLKTACRQNKQWQDAGYEPIPVSVNVSCNQLNRDDFIPTVIDALESSQLDPQYLSLEITENIVMKFSEQNLKKLHTLKQLGVKLILDDFGVGYSSLIYLKKMPVDVIKLDRFFMSDLPDDPDNKAIIMAILGLANGLGLDIVAEGVENPKQLQFLNENGCYDIQGFLLGRPQSPEKAVEFFNHSPKAVAFK